MNHGGLLHRAVNWNKPFLPQVAFVSDTYHTQQQGKKLRPSLGCLLFVSSRLSVYQVDIQAKIRIFHRELDNRLQDEGDGTASVLVRAAIAYNETPQSKASWGGKGLCGSHFPITVLMDAAFSSGYVHERCGCVCYVVPAFLCGTKKTASNTRLTLQESECTFDYVKNCFITREKK